METKGCYNTHSHSRSHSDVDPIGVERERGNPHSRSHTDFPVELPYGKLRVKNENESAAVISLSLKCELERESGAILTLALTPPHTVYPIGVEPIGNKEMLDSLCMSQSSLSHSHSHCISSQTQLRISTQL